MPFLLPVARWILLASLAYAPWAYGCTTAETIRLLNILLGVALVLWGVGTFATRRSYLLAVKGQRSEVSSESVRARMLPRAAFLLSASVLIIGWWMTLNARWIYDSELFVFVPWARLLNFGAGSVDHAISAAMMLRVTLLFGAALMTADLSREPVWLLRLWWTIALSGGSIALLGLIQKTTGADMIFWQGSGDQKVTTFFATYYYHANAGAYLNLVLPAAIALAVRSFVTKSSPLARAVTVSLSLFVLVAVMANTSRMGHLVTALLLVSLVIAFGAATAGRVRAMDRKTLLLAAVVLAFTLFAIARESHLDQAIHRWQQSTEGFDGNGRWLASRAALRGIGDAGPLGFGPGTFRVVFPYYTAGLGPGMQGAWRFLHEDYLQTVLEWGWVGSALWALILFGGIATGLKTMTKTDQQAKLRPRHRFFLTSAVLGLAGIAFHAVADFPLQIASLQLYVAMYLGVCWASSRWKVGTNGPSPVKSAGGAPAKPCVDAWPASPGPTATERRSLPCPTAKTPLPSFASALLSGAGHSGAMIYCVPASTRIDSDRNKSLRPPRIPARHSNNSSQLRGGAEVD